MFELQDTLCGIRNSNASASKRALGGSMLRKGVLEDCEMAKSG